MRIHIIAGHGRDNRGFLQIDKHNECNEGENNFRVYELLRTALEGYEDVIVTTARYTMDEDPSLPVRGGSGVDADLVLLIHSNAGGGTGPSMHMRPDVPDAVNDLATRIRDEIREEFHFVARARPNTYRVLNGTNEGDWSARRGDKRKCFYAELRHCPHPRTILVELAFHDHKTDARYLRTNRQGFADAITRAVAAQYGLKKLGKGKPYVTTESVNFRSGPGMANPIKSKLPEGTEITLHSVSAKWAKVRQGADIGYLSTDYIKEKPAAAMEVAPDGKLFRVLVDSFKYRDYADDLAARLNADGYNASLVLIDDPREAK